jgi:hypothetical protein
LPFIEYANFSPPKEVLSWLEDNPRFLGRLLLRDDVELAELRRTVFLSTDPRYDKEKYAFAAHHLALAFDEFDSLLKGRPELLKELHSCDSLSLVMIAALQDGPALRSSSDLWSDRLKRSAEKITGEEREKELRWLKIYELAKRVVPWYKSLEWYRPLSDPLAWLGEKAIPCDTWGTFVAFADAMPPHGLEHWLPDIEDFESREEVKTHEQMRAADQEQIRPTADAEGDTASVMSDFPPSPAEHAGEQATLSQAKSGEPSPQSSRIVGYLLYATAFALFGAAIPAEGRFFTTQLLILGVACIVLARVEHLRRRLDELTGPHRL